MEAVSTIFKQIRTLVLPLSAEQRLELIQVSRPWRLLWEIYKGRRGE